MDSLQELLSDLRSPDPTIRFSVLSKLEDLSLAPEQLNKIEQLHESEPDMGIRFHMQKLLAKYRDQKKTVCSIKALEEMLKAPEENEIALALMLESVKRADATLVAIALREAGWSGFSQKLLPSVLKFLKKYGSFEDTREVEKLCRHHDPRVLSAAIETLEKISPERLKDLIVPLLIYPNHGIRSRAVRLLHKWDPSEALRHFESMLFSEHSHEKQAALFQAFFFPFREIASLLLRYISVEIDEELIKKAGLIFRANPDRQTPACLLEIRQTCTGNKREIIDSILKGVLESLYQARIVNADPARMLETLEAHFREKRLKLLLERYEIALKSGDDQTRFQAAIKLCELVRHNVIQARSMLATFLARERNDKLKQKVEQFLRAGALSFEPGPAAQSDPEPVPVAAPAQKVFSELNEEERQFFLAGIDAESFKDKFEELWGAFSTASTEEQCSIIKLIEKFGQPRNSEPILSCLKSDNEEVLTAAIECLSSVNPETLHPFLPQLVKHRFDEVKIAAIKVFALYDKGQAISLLEKMLNSIKPMQRRSAIFCLGFFDFHSVRPTLLAALKTESDPDNRQQICSIIKSNADKETFYRLYCDWKTGKKIQSEFYEVLCKEIALELSQNQSVDSVQLLYQESADKLAEEQQIQQQRASYKLEKIQKIRKTADNNTIFDPSLIRFTVVAYLTGAVLTALIWFMFLAPSSAPPTERPIRKPKAAKANVITVAGKIAAVDQNKNEFELRTGDDRIFKIKLVNDEIRLPQVNDNFRGQIKVLSEEDKTFTAELLAAF